MIVSIKLQWRWRMNNLKHLPPPEKKVVAKELAKAGYSTRTLEEWVGADHTTISRWALEETPKEMQRYATQFRKQLDIYKQKGIALGVKRLLELLPKEKRVDQLVKGLEYLEGKKEPTTAIQINNYLKKEKDEFGI